MLTDGAIAKFSNNTEHSCNAAGATDEPCWGPIERVDEFHWDGDHWNILLCRGHIGFQYGKPYNKRAQHVWMEMDNSIKELLFMVAICIVYAAVVIDPSCRIDLSKGY